MKNEKKDIKECCTEYCELHKEYMSLGERLLIQDFSLTLIEEVTAFDYEKDVKRSMDNYIFRFKLTHTEQAIIYNYYDFILKNIFEIK